MTGQPPEPPPEALLLARKRRARRLSPAEAARLAGVSASTYRQIENGYHVPAKGLYIEKVAPAETLAQMLHAFGATPRELIDAGRADAAEILEGLILEESRGQAQEAPAPPGGEWLPALQADEAEIAPFETAVAGDVDRARRRYGAAAAGVKIFTGLPGRDEQQGKREAGTWDALAEDGVPEEERMRTIAVMRMHRARRQRDTATRARGGLMRA